MALVSMTPKDTELAARIATESFKGDAYFDGSYPPEVFDDRMMEYMRVCWGQCLQYPGHCYRIGNEETGYGICASLPPGADYDEKEWASWLDRHLSSLTQEQRQIARDRDLFSDGLHAKTTGVPIGQNNTLWVTLLCVEKRARGCGYGDVLLRRLLALADEHGWSASIETANPMARLWYQRAGFLVVNQGIIPHAQGDPCMWFLLRPSRPVSPQIAQERIRPFAFPLEEHHAPKLMGVH
ncbi:hypothetical protein PAPYR_2910 [Paratrimastix pyriformis]|uniref:N-acetyltransferase domain-containing protein n=1 Tax=Paratrimastix pyriformis TaxID=342808 RepID=A0ABQ8UQG2_9EUKA|nr:hypothetical protein PAPYR_2910 [Paratrimastix pyriformis]|eukprot:GAFH01003128.1.p1 GENE.GAFH01003128.1~~GAFH01003128.1.p1  ORF type:complete len:239 (-),score=9.42 GAFH01003128.1:216-932(-)